MSWGIVVLAAGSSRRLGVPKQLCRYQGESLLRRALKTALHSEVGPVFCLLGQEHELCRQEIGELLPPERCFYHPGHEAGMGTSIRAAIRELRARSIDLKGVIFCVCDQITLEPRILCELAHLGDQGEDGQLAAAHYGSDWGTPFALPSSKWDWTELLDGDKGLKKLCVHQGVEPAFASFPEGELDVDTQEDCVRFGVERCTEKIVTKSS